MNSFCFDAKQFDRIFPFHFILNEKLECIGMGPSLSRLCRTTPSKPIGFDFHMVRPNHVSLSYKTLPQLIGETVILKSHSNPMLVLRGQFELLATNTILFIGAPWLDHVDALSELSLNLEDFAPHDPLIDLLHVIKSREITNNDSREMLATISRQQKEQKALQQQLQSYANRMAALISNMNAGILLEDESRRVVLANKQLCELFKMPMPAEALIGMDCATMAEQSKPFFKDGDAFVQGINQILQNKIITTDERLATADGRIFQRDFIPVWNGMQYLGHLWMYQDVTEQVTNEDSLQKQREFYEQILNSIPSDVAVFNAEHKYLFVNPMAIRDEAVRKWIIGKDDEAYCRLRNKPLSIAADRRAKFNTVMATRQLLSWEEELKDREGKPMFHVRRFYPVLNKAGAVEMVIGYGIDITDRKNAEQQIQLNEKRYRNLFHYSQALILTHDLAGNILNVNPSVCRVLQLEESQIVGRHLSYFMPPGDEETMEVTYLDKIKTNYQTEGVFRVVNSAGDIIYLLYKNYLFEEAGLEPYIIGFSQDITERIKAEKELKLAKQKTEELASAKEKFLADMSHEIRTPMNGILGLASLLERSLLDEQQKEQLKMLQESANNLLVIVNDVLDLEKIVAGRLELETIPFNIYEKVKIATTSFKMKAEEKGVQLYMHNGLPKDLVVSGDPFRLSQVLNNLISNAVKFTDEGGVHIATSISKTEGDTVWVKYEVRDSGIGIPKDKLYKIFEPYVQARSDISRKYGGTGLGLAICKNLITMQQGSIEVESHEGAGSTFYFVIPYHVEKQLISQDDSIKTYDYTPLHGRHILVAEDVEINQYLVRHFLKEFGCVVTIVDDGRKAVQQLAVAHYDAILMDIQMPEMDGMQATKLIRGLSDKCKAAIPIVALTANALKGSNEKYLDAGMTDYLSKPFTKHALFETLERVITKCPVTPAAGKQKAPEAHNALYNLSLLQSMSNGDDGFVNTMVELFINTMPPLVETLREACRLAAWDKVYATAHKIKPSIDSMGITALKEVIRDVENDANKQMNPEAVAQKVALVGQTLDACIAQLKQTQNLVS